MSGLYAVGATLLSVAALALFLLRLGGKVGLALDAAAAGAALCATMALLLAPFDLAANPMRFAPATIAFGFAGLPEEALKMLGFAAFLRPHWRARSPRDVTLAAGALALGFATLENFFYVVRAGDALVNEAAARAATAAPMQVLLGIAGGYVVARAPGNGRGVAMGVGGWLGLALLHGVYDFGNFAARPDAVRFVAFDGLVKSLGLNAPLTLRLLVDGAEAATALAAAAALRALPSAPSARGFGSALAATLLAGACAIALYGAGEAYAADAWLPFATGLGFALPPFALGLLSLPERATFSRRWRVAAAVAACVAALAWGPASWRRLEGLRAQSQGAQFYAQREFEHAAGAYGRAVEMAPGDAEPLAQRAAVYAAAHNYAAALADLDKALGLKPTGALYAQRAQVNGQRNLPAAALVDLDAALTLDATNPQWRVQRAQARLETGDSDGAALDLAQARRQAPNDPGLLRMTALLEVDKGDFDAALRQLNARLHDDPGDRQATFQRGRVWFYKGDYERARDDFAALLVADPTLYPALWHDLAQRLRRQSAGDALKARLGYALKARLGYALKARLGYAPPAWPAPIALMLLAASPHNEARALAANDEERCEADVYFALSRLADDPGDLTAERLHAALAECPTSFIEYEGARAELRRLAR